MSKNTTKLLSFFLFLLISIPFYVSALPTGADTCNVEEMAKGAHGASSLQGTAGYKLNATMKTPGAFEFSITGPGNGIKGVLVYVLDANKKRIGKFITLPPNIKYKEDCDGKTTTVTHTNKNDKTFPLKLNWDSQGASGKLTVKSLVVRDFKDWAQLDDLAIDSTSGAATTIPAAVAGGQGGQDGQDTQSNGFLQKYSLFIIMISITTLLYIVGSITEAMLKRQQVKARAFAKTINGYGNTR